MEERIEMLRVSDGAGRALEIERYEFPDFPGLEKFFIENIFSWKREGYSTKVIGTVLLKLRYPK